MELRAVKGMNDILPDEAARWQRLEQAFREHVARYGYDEVRTPILEHTALFSRQIGETTDVVEKEMYSFARHGDELTVRPEGTAGAARAYVEHKVHTKEPVSRWSYLGPMFRGERPAKGRYRQFYQAGCELYGDAGPLADAEMIEMILSLLNRGLGIGNIEVRLNSLGASGTRARYRDALVAHFTPMKDKLSEDSQRRLEKNPLRILDSKDPRDREASKGAPSILELLDEADAAHFAGVRRHLDALDVRYIVDPTLVRGLDYYTRTLFEFVTTSGDLGAQSTVVGGGRYDNMIEGLGGPSVPAIGFAMGIERLLTLMPAEAPRERPAIYIAPLSDTCTSRALVLGRDLRARGVRVEVDGRGGRLKAMLRRADALGAKLCVILGDGELERGVASVKDLAGHKQDEVPLADAADVLAARARAEASPPPGEAR
ncbi:histidine--tRNA ligase [Polyangium mundeleinium]|uniref:Histidine--tRNA ligase n=1 Tax=Polyangium mundeleinium TaxID=2995306 RepID=A0ABT5ENP1_9BACT|nr:histidine--tRNA ligase [Polyangium mundeleinium]MDC0743460.1 histidine--tRNA ligase [Polyangium mundeleinium]